LALDEARERVSAAWINQQSTWPALYPAMPILAPDPASGISCWRQRHCSACQDSRWKNQARGATSP
jgi:hypothetical protein